MAIIGQRLSAPEAGWKRYDDTNVNISYESWGAGRLGQVQVATYQNYLNTLSYTTQEGAKIKFNFTGNKLRLITQHNKPEFRTPNVEVLIDNELYTYNEISSSVMGSILSFEITFSRKEERSVEIIRPVGALGNITLDAIDIDAGGELKPYNNNLPYMFISSEGKTLTINKNNVLEDITGTIVNDTNLKTLGFKSPSSLLDINFQSNASSQLLVYSNHLNPPKLELNAIPKPQLVTPKDDIIIDSLDSINNFILTTNESGSGIVRTIFSIDGGFTWMTYNTVSLQFEFIDISDLNNIKLNGIDTTTFNSLGIKWNEIIAEGKVRFAYYLEKELATDVAEISQLRINMDYTDSWSKSIHPTEYTYKFDNTGSYVTFLVDGTYKVNYIELVDVNETCGADITWEVF